MYAVSPLKIVVLPEWIVAFNLLKTHYKQLYKEFKNGKELYQAEK